MKNIISASKERVDGNGELTPVLVEPARKSFNIDDIKAFQNKN